MRLKAYDAKEHKILTYDKEFETYHDGSIRSAGSFAIERMIDTVSTSSGALIPNEAEKVTIEILKVL